jgi:hypothetical protein
MYLYEGHSIGSWRHTFDNMLEFFFAPDDESNERNINGANLLSLGGFSVLGLAMVHRQLKKEKEKEK